MEWLIGGIIGYLIGRGGRKTVYSTSYEVEEKYIGVVYYNTKTGKLIYFCSQCGGRGISEIRNASTFEEGKCSACNGAKVLQMIVPKETRKEIIKKVKEEKKRRKSAKKNKKS